MQRLRIFLAMVGAAGALTAVSVMMTEAGPEAGSVVMQRAMCSVKTDRACFHSDDPHLSSAPDPNNVPPPATMPATKTRPTVVSPRR